MGLTTSEKMLLNAQKGSYAIPAFNVENMEMIMGVIQVAEELNSPVIIQTTPSTIKYASLNYYLANAKVAAENANVPITMHLDHGSSFELAMQALRAGYTSIMIDASHDDFSTNIEISKSVVDACRPSNIPVEAELGKVGGKEDDLDGGDGGAYTDPIQAKEFVEKTGISSLAVAIGTAHGLYKGEPKLDLERLSAIQKEVYIPLVLHGGSGIPDKYIIESIKRGICKVNYATELRIAYTEGIKKILNEDPNTIDPKKYGQEGMKYVKEFVRGRMEVCGCIGKGNLN